MREPFSTDPVDHAVFQAMLERRRTLAATYDPMVARRILSELHILERAADILTYRGVGEEMVVACDEIVRDEAMAKIISYTEAKARLDTKKSEEDDKNSGIIYASATLRPTFLKESAVKGEIPGVKLEQKLKEVSQKMAGGQARLAAMRAEMEREQARLAAEMEEGQAPFVIDGRETGQIKILAVDVEQARLAKKEARQAPSEAEKWHSPMAHKQAPSKDGGQAGYLSKEGVYIPDYGWHAGTSSEMEEGQALSDWNPLDDVAEGQALSLRGVPRPLSTTNGQAPLSQARTGGRHAFSIWRKSR